MLGRIKGKLLLSYLTVILLTMVLFNLSLLRFFTSYYRQGKAESLLVNLNVFASLSTQQVIDRDPGVKFAAYNFASQAGMRLLVLDASGVVLGDSADRADLVGETLNRPEVAAAARGESVTTVATLPERGQVLYAAVPVTAGQQVVGVVFASTSLADIEVLLRQLQWRLGLVTLAASVTGGIVSYAIASSVSRRTGALTRAAREMAAGNLRPQLNLVGQDELAELSRAFVIMAGQLAQVEAARRQFLADASHELRTPLSAMKTIVETLRSSDDLTPEIRQEFLGDIEGEIDRLARLVSDLLALTRMDARTGGLKLSPTDAAECLAQAVDLVAPVASQQEIALTMDAPGPVVLPADGEQLLRVFLNLLDNAVQFTPAGGRVEAAIRATPDRVMVTVTDTGCGIPPADLPFIFERFYRVDKARARRSGGTGLGLAIAREIVRAHGGEITAASEPGVGSRFTVSLPR